MSETGQVIEIDPKAKYVLMIPKGMPLAELSRINDRLKEWLDSDFPFIYLRDDVILVKVLEVSDV